MVHKRVQGDELDERAEITLHPFNPHLIKATLAIHQILTAHQFRVLCLIWHNPGTTAGHLKERTGLSKPTIRAHVALLIRLGLVEARDHPNDRRRKSLYPPNADQPG